MKRKSALNRLIESDVTNFSNNEQVPPTNNPNITEEINNNHPKVEATATPPSRKTKNKRNKSKVQVLSSLDFKFQDENVASNIDDSDKSTLNVNETAKTAKSKAPSFKAVNKSKMSEFLDKNSNVNDDSDIDAELDADFLIQQDKEERIEKRNKAVRKIFTAVIIFGCIYMIFLMYGLLNTNYIYNDEGIVIAQKMTFEQIKAIEDYNKLASQYRQARMLYEHVLTLDYRVAAGVEDALIVAPEYDVTLDDIEELIIQLQAIDVPSKYSQVKNMLIAWVQTDIAVYCQRMSESISQNNTEYAQQAMQYREVVYNDFSLITENMVAIGQTIDGIDIEDILSWSPEKFVRENIGAVD